MPGSGVAPSLRDSHVAAALLRPENRIAAIVTLVVALAAVLLSRTPMEPGFSVDLRDEPRWSVGRSVSLLGFGRVTTSGRLLSRREARVVWNRPLPPRFALEIEGRAQPVPLAVEVSIGAQRHRLRFDAETRSHRIPVVNPSRVREIVLGRPWRPHVQLSLERLTIRELPAR